MLSKILVILRCEDCEAKKKIEIQKIINNELS